MRRRDILPLLIEAERVLRVRTPTRGEIGGGMPVRKSMFRATECRARLQTHLQEVRASEGAAQIYLRRASAVRECGVLPHARDPVKTPMQLGERLPVKVGV